MVYSRYVTKIWNDLPPRPQKRDVTTSPSHGQLVTFCVTMQHDISVPLFIFCQRMTNILRVTTVLYSLDSTMCELFVSDSPDTPLTAVFVSFSLLLLNGRTPPVVDVVTSSSVAIDVAAGVTS